MSVVSTPEPINVAGQPNRREENPAVVRHARTQLGDLLIVADGIGDAAAGSHASRKAADTISSRIEGMPAFFPSEIAVEEAVREANRELTATAARPDGGCSSSGVTLVVALLRIEGGGARVTIGRVGDSRAYLVRDRKLTLLTRGHSATPDMLDGKWTTRQQVEPDPDPSMPTRNLGEGLNLHVEMREISLEAGDTLLLCSNGLWRRVSDEEIERVLADGARSVEEASCALQDLVLDAGGHDNVAIEIARLTQSSSSPAATTPSVNPESEVRTKATLTRRTPAIEWLAPEIITYGVPLNDAQLNATSSVPGTFQYHPGPGAVLAAGEHTLSVVFTPSNQSDYAPAQAAVKLSVAKATPAVSWLTPDPINNTTPLGSAQLNASASVPGTFAYRPATGETLGAGAHTLSVTFTPADYVNYTQAQASASLTVIEPVPAVITWPSPPSISYGTVLGGEQLSARSSVPGSFLYLPGPGIVLPPGEHKLSVIFTPDDQVKYIEGRAAVMLTVEALPMVVPLLNRDLLASLTSDAVAEPAATNAEPVELPSLVRRTGETGNAANESPIPPSSPHAAEAPASEDETIEVNQAEIPLFRAFGSSIEDEEEQEAGSSWFASNWMTILWVVLAIPMLGAIIFLVVKAHSGAPLVVKLVVRPPWAAGDNRSQSNMQDPSHQVKVTVNQIPAGTAAEPASKSEPDNNDRATKPTQLPTEATHGELAAQTEIPQGSKTQAAAKIPSSASAGSVHAFGSGGRDIVIKRHTQLADRDGASSPVFVSAGAAAGRLMESRTPIYPPIAKALGVSGAVELDATISKDGTVKDLRAVSGPVQLRQAAVHAARTWRYRPFTHNNEPMEVRTTIKVIFSVDK